MVHSFYSSAQPSGENTVVLNEVDALRRAGHEVALFAAHTDELEGEVFYKLRSGMRVATGYGRNPLKAINEFSPDVVHNLFPAAPGSYSAGRSATGKRTKSMAALADESRSRTCGTIRSERSGCPS